MPFETATTPFTGDNDIADFMDNVWLPFARDDCQWTDNQAPVRSPGLPVGETEVWCSRQQRGGSPLAVTSPFTTLPPHVAYRVGPNDHLHIFTGTSFATSAEPYDLPGNPMNAPVAADYSLGANGTAARCLLVNDLPGTFERYWMFSDAEGRYVHCVIKISNRHYRHFHVGLLTPLHPDLDASSFYVTGHFWDQLDPSGVSGVAGGSTPPANGEHSPYSNNHRTPFQNSNFGNETDGAGLSRAQFSGNIIYMPNLVSNSPEIEWFKTMGADDLTAQDALGLGIRKTFGATATVAGSVNTGVDDVIFGVAAISGWASSLGAVLFASDRTFTSNSVPLVPIYVSAANDFQSQPRHGVVAQIPDVFRINMANIAAEEEITVGSDTYVCFPMINKDSANVLAGEGYSGYEGLAYKKIVDLVP